MIYRFRIMLDVEEDVFRDIEIASDSDLEEFHNVIIQSFGFDGHEMASFYTTNEFWEEEDEISLFDVGDIPGESRVMSETLIEEIVSEEEPRLLYVYDFMNLWTFMIELAEIVEREEGRTYPNLMFAQGQVPDAAPDKEFISEKMEPEDGEDDFLFDEDFDLDPDDYDNLGFGENWN